MARFEQDGISFDPPEGWLQTSIVTLHKPAEDPDAVEICTFNVSKEPLAAGETLRTHTQKKLIALSKSLPNYRYVSSKDGEIAGKAAQIVNFAWTSETVRILQTLVAMEIDRPPTRAALVVLTAASIADALFDRLVFADILGTFEFVAPKSAEVEAGSEYVPIPSRRPR